MCIEYEINTHLLKGVTMRTNIIIDDKLMAEALKLSDVKTKKGVVDKALKLLVQVQRQEAIRKLKGKLKWEGDLSELRID